MPGGGAPAMNDAMWSKAPVQENISTLRHRGMMSSS